VHDLEAHRLQDGQQLFGQQQGNLRADFSHRGWRAQAGR
jgi:hypothetical protein